MSVGTEMPLRPKKMAWADYEEDDHPQQHFEAPKTLELSWQSHVKRICEKEVEEDSCNAFRLSHTESLLTSASGESDDACSVCSWTTDQGESSGSEAFTATSSDAALPAPSSSVLQPPAATGIYCPWGSQENFMNTPVMAFAYDPTYGGYDPYAAMTPMCVGYMPVLCEFVPQSGTFVPSVAPAPVAPLRSPNMTGSQYAPGQWANQFSSSASALTPCRKDDSAGESPKTTVILRNLPVELKRDMLMQLLDDEGFSRRYDFLHLPVDFRTKVGLGYAIVNLVDHDVAEDVHKHFNGFSNWPCVNANVCEVAWNDPHQGLGSNIERYRNSPLMHSSIPEVFRPVLLQNGKRKIFPAPTSQIRPPRIRHRKSGMPVNA